MALVAWAVHIWAHACNALSQPTKFSILHRSRDPLPSTKKTASSVAEDAVCVIRAVGRW